MQKIITALVPMRHHSQRVPGKNFRPLDGQPLYAHILTTLLSVPELSKILVDTDSSEIIDGIKAHFPSVECALRPEALRADAISMNEILMYDTSIVESDFFLQTHSTNPLLKSETISKAIQTLTELFPSYDSLFSVTRLQTRLWDGLGRALNHNPNILLQTQDLPPVYEENSCMYLFTRDTLMQKRNRLGDRPYLFEIDAEEAWDIDEEVDFKIVELMIKARKSE
ncbi:MAG: acylneuraminate cytidylyltransferase family protein [Chloroflexi bacterium]|nr:MAG: acylneuraminate cytidylyltransferase family protein [Chloroflexota bacterium]MBA4375100.1 acylneuraminate cytidylyltransferase [Anaerolinea sp.]